MPCFPAVNRAAKGLLSKSTFNLQFSTFNLPYQRAWHERNRYATSGKFLRILKQNDPGPKPDDKSKR
jgi:hypothetical protein